MAINVLETINTAKKYKYITPMICTPDIGTMVEITRFVNPSTYRWQTLLRPIKIKIIGYSNNIYDMYTTTANKFNTFVVGLSEDNTKYVVTKEECRTEPQFKWSL